MNDKRAFRQHTGFLGPLVDGTRNRKVAGFIEPGWRVCDIGCGPGLLIPHLPAGCDYVGVDVDPAIIDFNRGEYPRSAFHRADACRDPLPFQDGEFDAVVLAAFLEHVDDPRALFREVSRVLKPGGKAVATAPSKMGGAVHHFLSIFRLVSHDAAEEHKDFPNRETLSGSLKGTKLRLARYERFELGMNQIFILVKDAAAA